MVGVSFNQIRVNRSALRHNYRLLRERIGDKVRLLAMVKADGYGHGMIDAARAFSEEGCRDFGVAEIGEGIRLRNSGISGSIFIFLGFVPSDAVLCFEYDLVPVIYDMEIAKALSVEAVKRDTTIAVHVKVDCGMTRLGVTVDSLDDFIAELENLPGIEIDGLASHFPKADDRNSSHTSEQFRIFKSLEKGDLTRHTANSGGILYFPDTCCDMVRAGISLYGYYPDGFSGVEYEHDELLQPAMEFSTKVLQVKKVPANVGVSYGHTYITKTEGQIAVLPVGYEDGLSRNLSNRGEVLINGKRAKIRGRICMNLCMVDVTHIKDIKPGDPVIILGSQGKDTISGDQIAGWMDSISYEVLCLFGNNNERKCI
jgi:alanine racemase